MKPVTRIGVNNTKRCNWTCRHCFYLRESWFRSALDEPLEEQTAQVDRSIANGFDHAVLIGFGEPSLSHNVLEFLYYCHERGMATSIITNGATGIRRFENMFALGLDHVHVSRHGLGKVLDKVACRPGTSVEQDKLLDWVRAHNYPYRVNATLQHANYQQSGDNPVGLRHGRAAIFHSPYQQQPCHRHQDQDQSDDPRFKQFMTDIHNYRVGD